MRLDGYTVPKPELEGTACCLECLKRMDPDNVAVKLHLRKEVLVVAAIGEELTRRGFHDRVAAATRLLGSAVHDCALGQSRRRPDLFFLLSGQARLVLTFENDENEHDDRSTSCEHAKLA